MRAIEVRWQDGDGQKSVVCQNQQGFDKVIGKLRKLGIRFRCRSASNNQRTKNRSKRFHNYRPGHRQHHSSPR